MFRRFPVPGQRLSSMFSEGARETCWVLRLPPRNWREDCIRRCSLFNESMLNTIGLCNFICKLSTTKTYHRRPQTDAEIAHEIWTFFVKHTEKSKLSGLNTMSQAFTEGIHKNLILRARFLCVHSRATNTKQDDQRHA